MQQVEPAVGLHVEDQIEFLRILVGQEVAAFNSGGVQQNIDTSAASWRTFSMILATASESIRFTLK